LGLISLSIFQDLHPATGLTEEQLTVDRIGSILFKAVPDTPDVFKPGALDVFARYLDPLQRTQPTDLQPPDPTGWI
jgi:hypothetical protein